MSNSSTLSFENSDDGTVIELTVNADGTAYLTVSDVNVIDDDEDVITPVGAASLAQRDLARLSNFIQEELDNGSTALR